MAIKHRALIVITSHAVLGKTGQLTGFNYEELAAPYWRLHDAGYDVDIASIKGGKASPDPSTLKAKGDNSVAVERFLSDEACLNKIKYAAPITSIVPARYRIIFLAGGRGAMWDFPQSIPLGNAISLAYSNGAIIGAICHGVAGLITANDTEGKLIIDGMRISAFTDAEEKANRTDRVVPFLLESKLRELGGVFENGANNEPFAVCDGNVVTGQNPASIGLVIQALLMTANATMR